jgi:tetratricopeptide (TPR) repeat protein
MRSTGRKRSRERPLPEEQPPAQPQALHLFQIAALVLLALLAYSNSFHAGFVLDNRGLILNDPRIREASGSNFGLIVDHTYWWPNGESGLYRPFATLSWLFNYAILGNGAQPAGYHWINFLLHAANVLLVFFLALRLLRLVWPAFFIAALWAVHPVLTEAVTNIVGRADLLAAMGVLAGLLFYLKSVEASGNRRAAWLAALIAVVAIGVFSKEAGVVVFGAILLYEFTFRRKWTRAQSVGLVVVAIPISWMLLQRHAVLAATQPMEIPFTDNPIAWASFLTGRLTALEVIARDFAAVLWPATLSADYSWAQIPLFSGAGAEWLAVLCAIAIVPITILLFRWNRTAFFFFVLGLLWLAPAANMAFPTGTIMAERLLYLPALGIAACVVLGIYRAPKLAPAVLCVIISALAVRTWLRNRDWKDDLTIAEASVNASPNSFKTHDLLANVLFAQSQTDLAIAESEKTLAILAPLPVDRKPADPYRFAANCYMLRGEYARAIPALETYAEIRKTEPDAWLMLSTAYLNMSQADRAGRAAARARDLAPLNPQVYAQMAESNASAGKLDDAAIALIEGVFVTGDQSLRKDLVELYQRAMAPGSCMLTTGPSGPAINPNCPAVHAQACAASEYVIRTLMAAGQTDAARARQEMFTAQFRCPGASDH